MASDEAKQIKEVHPDAYKDYQRFQATMGRKADSVTLILRVHLLAEYYLDQVILVKLPRGDVIIEKERRFDYRHKVALVDSFNCLSRELIKSLEQLNTVRNSCSHVHDYELSESDIDKIGAPLGKAYYSKKRNSDSKEELLKDTLFILMARFTGKVNVICKTNLDSDAST